MGGMSGWAQLGMAGFQADMQRNAALTAGVHGEIAAIEKERQAKDEIGSSIQLAQQYRRRARYLRSRGQAVAGASGAGGSQVEQILDDIENEGEMSALNTLFTGQSRARALRRGADIARTGGDGDMAAGLAESGSTMFNSFTDFAKSNPSFFQKYGGSRARTQSIGTGTAYSDFANAPDAGMRNA